MISETCVKYSLLFPIKESLKRGDMTALTIAMMSDPFRLLCS